MTARLEPPPPLPSAVDPPPWRSTDFAVLPISPRLLGPPAVREARSPVPRGTGPCTFGHDGRLNYQIIVNWLIAAHKSQGTMQLLMNQGEQELFWLYEMNDPSAHERAASLFRRLETSGG